MENTRLWGRIIRDHRIAGSETVPLEDGDLESALRELCRRFDIPRPLQLPKHDRDLTDFGRTAYTGEHFMESVSFEKLEIEILLPQGEKRRSGAPRSPLSDA